MYEQIDAYIRRLVRESSPQRTAWNMERVRQGKPAHWNYIDGCMLNALLTLSEITGEAVFADFVETFVDSFVGEDGTIRTYDPAKYNLDDINEGRVLFPLYRKTGREKYRLAADRLAEQLKDQPRTWEGNFWHKRIYPDQVWLDGIYMAQPFRALYARELGDRDYSDIVHQIETVRRRMFDPEKGLYYHGYDASKTIFWADPTTGCSKHFWLRAIGWFATALADLMEIVDDPAALDGLRPVFTELMAGIAPYAEADTGMYYQVVDQGAREGNYLETSGSSMIAYAMLKGARLGVLSQEYAILGKKTFDGILRRYFKAEGADVELGGICLVAGLGPADNPRRDGSYEYYISEPIVKNDAKGVAPLVMCYTEVIRSRPA
jgi:unsaturated rhamnogalacturonyl hydrolase